MTYIYAMATLWPKRKHQIPIVHLLSLTFTIVSIMCLEAQAQSPENRGAATGQTTITPLEIGDPIPDELWDLPLQVVNHPQGKETITLSEYRDKLIILDFWATWCVPCIRNFPKLHDIQNEFGDQIKVLAVTQEDTEKINTFFESGAGKEHPYVNSVINDSVVSTYFPHRGVPHIAWIDPNGKVLNTTRAEEITTANVQAILDNGKVQMAGKVDIDRDRPLFLSDNFGESIELKSYSIFAKGGFSGLPSAGNFKKNKDGKVHGRQFTNLPIMNIYRPIIWSIFQQNNDRYNSKRAIINVKQPELLNWILKNESRYEDFNLYNYELIVPENKADSLYYYMLADLNRYSDYVASIEKREVDCLVLVRTSNKDKIKSKGGEAKNTFPRTPSILINRTLSSMVSALNGETSIKLPIIDETGYDGNADIEISGIKDLSSLKKELNNYDLDLIETKRTLNMFVLKDK